MPPRLVRILYVGMRWEYGEPHLGESFEETNFKSSLIGMGCTVEHFDFMERARAVGVKKMRQELVSVARNGEFDLVFFFLFTDQIDVATITAVGSAANAPTINWFADDHWRFQDFTSKIGHAFDLCITTDEDSLIAYELAGISNVLLSQWACNKYLYRPVTSGQEYEVTFIGQPHGNRREVVERLKQRGIHVTCWGNGWENGRLSTADMISVFSRSAITLNLSNSSRPTLTQKAQHRLTHRGKRARPPLIKGRTFEIPGCGGFQLCDSVPHLGRYFEPMKEIGVVESEIDLAEQIRCWLDNPIERQRIANAGLARIDAEHTYDHRFAVIFDRLGIS